ncbi:hypothetical protein [Terasakiella pusilla]|uniref:hypothetical protein n=1 Tax=Terasakiella pusilla TaxID=64973 RepID=UPI003AA80534
MRLIELASSEKRRQSRLNKETEEKSATRKLMYADFEYINRNQSHLLSEIESKLEDLKQLKNELELLIDKVELDFASKAKIKKLAQKRVKKIIGR